MDGKLFMNPNLKEAEKSILKVDADDGDFEFIDEFETFYDAHFKNVMERNEYVAANSKEYKDGDLSLETLWKNKDSIKEKYVRNDLWSNMVRLLGDEYSRVG